MLIYRIDNILPYTDFEPYADTNVTKSTEEKAAGRISFDDILDIVNPLQHIPIVSTIYRSATGDEISPGSRIIGGALFGQLFGLIASIVNVVVEAVTGKDIGGHVMTALKGDSTKTETVASNKPEQNEYPEILDALNYAAYSEGIKKYNAAKEILESKNSGIESYTSLMA